MNYCRKLDRDKLLKRSEQLGNLLWRLGYRKEVVFKNLDIAFPEKDRSWKENIAKKSLINISRVLLEFPRAPDYVKSGEIEDIFSIESGKELIEQYKDEGLILVTGHIGNWELLGAGLSWNFGEINALAYRQKTEVVNKVLTRIRNASGIRIIYHNEPKKKLIRALKDRKILVFLVDQNTIRKRGIFVDFFGVPAITVTFPAKLAVKYKKPILFVYSYFEEKTKTYKCEISKINFLIDKDEEETACNIVRAYTKKIEEAVRKHPDQYLWTHKRWKTRPKGEKSIY